ncbi:hypothetical protein FPOAC2_03666 [Fusarium poae]
MRAMTHWSSTRSATSATVVISGPAVPSAIARESSRMLTRLRAAPRLSKAVAAVFWASEIPCHTRPDRRLPGKMADRALGQSSERTRPTYGHLSKARSFQ